MANRQVSIFINGRQVENSLRGIRTEKRKINRELQRMVIGSEEYIQKSKEYDRIDAKLSKHTKKLYGTNQALGKMAGGITKFAGIAGVAFGVAEVVQYGKKLFNLASEMELLGKKAATVFGQALPLVTRQAEQNASAMGLTTSAYIDQATAIGDLLIPMKFTREEAAGISSELVNLSGALSEWTGGQVTATQVSETLSKALLGEREQLKTLGISIQEADVKARLAEKGLSKLTGTALQQAKAMATLELVMEKSTDAQAAYAENSDTMARRSAELSAKFTETQERLATVLIPVFEKLFTIVENGIGLIEFLGQQFEGATAGAERLVDGIAEQEKAFSDLQSELSPLLSRLDELQAKTNRSETEQKELATIIQRVADLTPTAVTEIDNYGNALSVSSAKSREFLESEKARLEYVNKEAITEITEEIASLQQAKDNIERTLQRGSRGLFNIELSADDVRTLTKRFGELQRQIDGASTQLDRLRGGNLQQNDASSGDLARAAETERRRVAAEAALQQASEDAAEKERQSKAYEQAQKARRKHLERLSDIIDEAREENRLSQLSESERELEEIRIKYQKQIDLASELERAGFDQATAQRKELEALRDQELEAAQLARNAERRERELLAAEEQLVEDLEIQRAHEERRQELETEINERVREVVLSERALAIVELNEQYDALLEQARLYGVDTLELEIARRKQLQELDEKFNAQKLKTDAEAQKAQIEAQAQGYRALGNVVSEFYNGVLDEQARATGLGKVLALINIGVKSAEALASATAASAGVPFPGNLAAIASSAATVIGTIAQAKNVLNATPSVPQRKEGSYFTVTGEDDGKQYRAKHIGRPQTGRLPNYPVLIDSITGSPVLGSERGAEYFVAHHDLMNPAVFRHVSAIENITRQRVDGGFSTEDRSAPSALSSGSPSAEQPDSANTAQLAAAISVLNSILERGIPALIGDDAILDGVARLQELNEASGGVLR